MGRRPGMKQISWIPGMLFLWLCSLSFAFAGYVHPITYLYKGRTALKKGQFNNALAAFQKAARKRPHWGIVHFELARAQHFTGVEPTKVRASLTKALTTKPTSSYPNVHAFAGVFFESAGENDRALRHYSRAIRMGIISPTPCLRASRLWMQQDEHNKAIRCLSKLLAWKRKTKDVHPLLARAYTAAGSLKKAARHWKLALFYHQKWILLWKDAEQFFAKNLKKFRGRDRRNNRRYLWKIRRRIKRFFPKKRPRKMRPLLPSKR